MDIIKLRAFCTVAKLNSISEAAKQLNYTQPAISAQIRDLENIFKVKLLERVGRGIRVSESGRIILPYAERLLRDYDSINAAIPQALDPDRGYIRLGASSLPGVHLVPQLLADFGRSFPEICFSLSIEKANRIEKMILDRQIDAGFIGRKSPRSPRPSLEEHLLMNDRLVAIVAPANRLAAKNELSIEDLAFEPLILPSRDMLTRRSVEERFHHLGLALDLAFEVNNTEAIKRMVAQNLGASILCELEVRREVEAGWVKALPVRGLDLSRYIYLYARKNEPLDPPFQEFLEYVTSQYGGGKA
jgi:DNA-binding transcriptional LysR family regulator